MTDKEKEEERFLVKGVTCDSQIENAKKHIEEVCRELKKKDGTKDRS